MTVTALLAGLAEPAGWPDLAVALGQANGGSPDALLGRLTPLLTKGGGFDVALATACNDVRRRMTPAEVSEPDRAVARRPTRCSARPWRSACSPAGPGPRRRAPLRARPRAAVRCPRRS